MAICEIFEKENLKFKRDTIPVNNKEIVENISKVLSKCNKSLHFILVGALKLLQNRLLMIVLILWVKSDIYPCIFT